MQMGTRFRIIEGGKLVVSNGRRGSSHSLAIVQSKVATGAPSIRYKRPDIDARLKQTEPVTGRYWRKTDHFDYRFFFGMILAPAAVFYAVWNGGFQTIGQQQSALSLTMDGRHNTESASFSLCHEGGGQNCVVDGDTLYYQGAKIRIADIDTPETHPPRCAEEARLGEAATLRLHALVNAGPFQLQTVDRDVDSYGRKLRIISRGGVSIGNDLVSAGLARWYEGGRKSWC